MSELEPLGGDSFDAGLPQEGNRPAQNARLSTPGQLPNQGYQGAEDAGDFLGLGAEMEGGGAFDLMADTGAAQHAQPETDYADEPQQSAWVDTEPEAYADEPAIEGYDEEPEVHGSWSEEQPARGGSGKLIGVVAGVLVVGALGAVGVRFLGVASQEPESVGPIASKAAPAPQRSETTELLPVEDQSGGERVGIEQDGSRSESLAGLVPALDDQPALDAEAAREAFDAERGDAPPVWFDPEQDSQAAEPETGWSEEAEAVTRASTFVGDPGALLAMQDESELAAQPAPTEATTPARAPVVVVARLEEQPVEDVVEEAAPVEADPGTASSIASTVASTVANDGEPSATPTLSEESVTPVVASSQSVPSASTTPAPEVVAAVLPTEETGAEGDAAQASRVSRTTELEVADVLLAPSMDSGNLRQADAKDLKGVWSEASVPMEALGNKTKVLTPNVGRVRVVLKSKDIFEGKLYAVGQGSVWLESQYGRISVDGKRIDTVSRIDTKEGTPALGSTGSQNLAGLERVRVKTPGGTFYGKVISRDDKTTTLITEDGAKLTLANADVELLTDVPKVTIGGKVDAKDGATGTAKKP